MNRPRHAGLWFLGVLALASCGRERSRVSAPTPQGEPPPPAAVTAEADIGERASAAIEADYSALTGTWQLVKSEVDGVPVSEAEVQKTVLITDHDEFRFPADAGVGTAPLGKFTIDPTKNPKQVDSTSFSGPEKGQVSLGIYEVIDANNKRACWAKPGKPRPTSFDSTPGSGWTVQDWRLITKDVGKK